MSGTRAARRARTYLRRELAAAGLRVEERHQMVEWQGESRRVTHLFSEIPGDSPDVLLLAAHYDTHELHDPRLARANDGASGAALLLELARILSQGPRSYTIWLVFLDGDALRAERDGERLGSRAFAEQLARDGQLESIRLGVFFDGVAGRDLAIARDLRSHRMHRETFWDSAAALGFGEAFSRDRGFATPGGSHEAFLSQGLRRVVAIVGDRPPEGQDSHDGADALSHYSPRSLAVVGQVAQESIARVEDRLARIDRFVRSPLDGLPRADLTERDPAAEAMPSADAEPEAPAEAVLPEVHPDTPAAALP